jgi:hypothetical protein
MAVKKCAAVRPGVMNDSPGNQYCRREERLDVIPQPRSAVAGGVPGQMVVVEGVKGGK